MVGKWTKIVLLTCVFVAPAFQASQAQQPRRGRGGESALERFDAAGPFRVMQMNRGGFTFFVPQPLGQNGMKHPVVTWGNGTFTTPQTYTGLLRNFASHGMIVVASNNSNVGTGRQLIEGLDIVFEGNRDSSSMFNGVVDTTKACSAGHSQGGGGAVIAAGDPRITCSAPVAPEINLTSRAEGSDLQQGDVVFFGGARDNVAPVPRNAQRLFDAAENVNAILAVRDGITHNEILGDGGVLRGYVTAFLAAELLGDPGAKALFFPDDNCGICTDSDFTVQRNFDTAEGPAAPRAAAAPRMRAPAAPRARGGE